ncbi:MAG: MoxR family ATPase, partial [Desulfurococcales archaeon]|nr:MoxR family ATPase [Desulfurococcales archaeon]
MSEESRPLLTILREKARNKKLRFQDVFNVVKKAAEQAGLVYSDDMLENIAFPIYAQLRLGRPIVMMFAGPPGSGKTELAMSLARLLAGDYLFVQAHPESSAEDFLYNIVPDPNSPGGFRLQPGILIDSIELSKSRPTALIIDEIDKTRPPTDYFFLDFLQNGRVSAPAISSKPFKANMNNLMIIFTSNDTRMFDPAFLRRVARLEFVPPPASLVEKILVERYGVNNETAQYLAKLYQASQKMDLTKPITIQELAEAGLAIDELGGVEEVKKTGRLASIIATLIAKNPEDYEALASGLGRLSESPEQLEQNNEYEEEAGAEEPEEEYSEEYIETEEESEEVDEQGLSKEEEEEEEQLPASAEPGKKKEKEEPEEEIMPEEARKKTRESLPLRYTDIKNAYGLIVLPDKLFFEKLVADLIDSGIVPATKIYDNDLYTLTEYKGHPALALKRPLSIEEYDKILDILKRSTKYYIDVMGEETGLRKVIENELKSNRSVEKPLITMPFIILAEDNYIPDIPFRKKMNTAYSAILETGLVVKKLTPNEIVVYDPNNKTWYAYERTRNGNRVYMIVKNGSIVVRAESSGWRGIEMDY